ncbi:MAG: low specificity L-threonine aldolase [Steroidobacteraceae bacterium]
MSRDDIHTSFRSDNDAGASLEVLQAMAACNEGPVYPYGGDIWTRRAEEQLARVFECELRVLLVSTGTAANSLALAAMAPPWGSVLCHRQAHIHTDECGAPEFFGSGLKLVPSASAGSLLDPGLLRGELSRGKGDVHSVQPSAVSITQSTEEGQIYSPAQVGAIGDICRELQLPLHMDGARFANALVAQDCTPAQLTWQAGVDLLSFGATKNGALSAEALIVFNDALWDTLPFRRKRAGHLLSKMRFVAAQMHAYLQDDLWLRNARHANAMARRMAEGLATVPGITSVVPALTNILFVRMPQPLLQGLFERGFDFYHGGRWEVGVVRLVTSFRTTVQMVDGLVNAAREIQLA